MATQFDDDLEARIANLSPPVAIPPSVEDFADRLRELEDQSEHEVEAEPEELPEDGKLILTYKRAVVRRDEQNRIIEIVSSESRKFIERDVFGTIVAVTEVTETEEPGEAAGEPE